MITFNEVDETAAMIFQANARRHSMTGSQRQAVIDDLKFMYAQLTGQVLTGKRGIHSLCILLALAQSSQRDDRRVAA